MIIFSEIWLGITLSFRCYLPQTLSRKILPYACVYTTETFSALFIFNPVVFCRRSCRQVYHGTWLRTAIYNSRQSSKFELVLVSSQACWWLSRPVTADNWIAAVIAKWQHSTFVFLGASYIESGNWNWLRIKVWIRVTLIWMEWIDSLATEAWHWSLSDFKPVEKLMPRYPWITTLCGAYEGRL